MQKNQKTKRGLEMEQMMFVVLFVLLIRAVYTDIRTNKIENKLVIFGWLTGLCFSWCRNGVEGCISGVKMTGVVILLLFVLYLWKGLGAGDIKLLGMLAAFYPEEVCWIVAGSFFLGGGIAVGRMVVRKIQKRPVYVRGDTLHFSVPITLSVLCKWMIDWTTY